MGYVFCMSAQYELAEIARKHGKYSVDAYVFVGEGLHHAARRLGRHEEEGAGRHISAHELVEGILDLAAQRYGILGSVVLGSWDIKRSEDIGQITFHLIEAGLFGKQPGDQLSDFDNGPVFRDQLHRLTKERILAEA